MIYVSLKRPLKRLLSLTVNFLMTRGARRSLPVLADWVVRPKVSIYMPQATERIRKERVVFGRVSPQK